MELLSGPVVAAAVYSHLSTRIARLKENNIIPGLAVILVGDDPASQVYVRNKARRFEKLNLFSKTFRLGADSSEQELISLIQTLNKDEQFHGILVQLPLPSQMDENRVLDSVDPRKDVDGFHPVNLGLLAQGRPCFIPCTPKGIMRILEHYDIPLSGKHVVVIGRSNIVGRPISILSSLKTESGNATTTLCHSGTSDIAAIARMADVLIVAVGRPEMINRKYVKRGAVVIDVGINRVTDDSVEKGYRLAGDVNFNDVQAMVSAITPVPGGVGPMTIAMLVENTVEAAEKSL